MRTHIERFDDGREIEFFTFGNALGLELCVMSYGAIIVSLRTPDRDGRFEDIVLGHERLAGYQSNTPYFGAVVGRYANRIRGGEFELDGQRFRLSRNEGRNTLHGGLRGFDQALWAARGFERGTTRGVELALTSPDGDQGFPGTLEAQVTYTLDDENALRVEYRARTDRATLVNLTQHSYFNLGGEGSGSVLAHEIALNADHYLPVDAEYLPSGPPLPVEGTRFDFRAPAPIGERACDHTFVIARARPGLAAAARVCDPVTGRTLEIETTEPGLQFYTGNFLDGSIRGKSGQSYARHAGFALEPQHYPDSPHHPEFPEVVLRPGGLYTSSSVYRFGVRRG